MHIIHAHPAPAGVLRCILHNAYTMHTLSHLPYPIRMPHRNPIDWEDPGSHPAVKREPRKGARAILRCTVDCREQFNTTIVVYCLHLEVFCGMLARMEQMADVMIDVEQVLMAKGRSTPVAIMGDLNTMAHGIARLSPNYCCDHMRWRSLGLYEAQVWQRHIFQNTGEGASLALRAYGLSKQT